MRTCVGAAPGLRSEYSAFGVASTVTLADCCGSGLAAVSDSARVGVSTGVVGVCAGVVAGVGTVAAGVVFTTSAVSFAEEAARRDGNKICVPTMTIAISTTAITVRLSMHLRLIA